MNIIEIAREAGLDKAYWLTDDSPVQAFANAVIKAHTEELIAGAGEPACWITAAGEGFRMRTEKPVQDTPLGWDGLYTASQVAAAVAKERKSTEEAWSIYDQRIDQVEAALKEWLDKTEWVQESSTTKELGLHRADVLKQRIATLESTLKVALEALLVFDVPPYMGRTLKVANAVEQIKEVLK